MDKITIKCDIKVELNKVWELWTDPKHIVKWYFASDDWHAPYAENDVSVGGKFKTTMAAKDGGFSFDFEGIYTAIILFQKIEYTLPDGRSVITNFIEKNNRTEITETFDIEKTNSAEQQKSGWQAILNNFKKYAEQF